jgi:hypothetical protein
VDEVEELPFRVVEDVDEPLPAVELVVEVEPFPRVVDEVSTAVVEVVAEGTVVVVVAVGTVVVATGTVVVVAGSVVAVVLRVVVVVLLVVVLRVVVLLVVYSVVDSSSVVDVSLLVSNIHVVIDVEYVGGI